MRMARDYVNVKVFVRICSSVKVCFHLASSAQEDTDCAGLTAGMVNQYQHQREPDEAHKVEEQADLVLSDPVSLIEEYSTLCDELQSTCESLGPPVPPSAKPKVVSISDVKLRTVRSFWNSWTLQDCMVTITEVPMQIGLCIEGRSEHLEGLVNFVCSNVSEQDDSVRIAVKNIIYQEANRKSYSSEKRALFCLWLDSAPVLPDSQWRVTCMVH